MSIKFFQYEKCSSCRKALKFLQNSGVIFQSFSIIDSPPTKSELIAMKNILGTGVQKLFNTSGKVYREMELSKKLTMMTEDAALDLLAANGRLIKRPFLITASSGTVGFGEAKWRELLNSQG